MLLFFRMVVKDPKTGVLDITNVHFSLQNPDGIPEAYYGVALMN